MTPFERAGYTKDTKFKVLKDFRQLITEDIVTLYEDDGSFAPWFKNEDGRINKMYLPSMAPEGIAEELEVYEEDSIKKENIGVKHLPLTIPRTNLGTTKIYLSDSIELPSIDSDENGTYVEINNEVIVNAYKNLRDSVI